MNENENQTVYLSLFKTFWNVMRPLQNHCLKTIRLISLLSVVFICCMNGYFIRIRHTLGPRVAVILGDFSTKSAIKHHKFGAILGGFANCFMEVNRLKTVKFDNA